MLGMKIFKNIFIAILCITIFSFFVNNVFAADVNIISRETITMDETLSAQSDIYSLPQKIYITQITGFNENLFNDSQEWIKLLYYYSVTRLGLNDIPFNYLIDRSGNIYEGSKGGTGVNPGLKNGENVVLIGIMDNNMSLSPRASTSLASLAELLSYRYGIKDSEWKVVDLRLEQQESSLSLVTFSDSKSVVINSITNALESVEWSNTEHLGYKGKILSVEYDKEVEIGQKLNVKVEIKNENDFTWFGDLTYIYISTLDSVESPHAINKVWESFSKPTYLKSMYITPGESAELQFQMEAKSKPGEYKQSFYFMKSAENIVEGSTFDVVFNITKGNNKLIEVVSPEFGYVNIRECRWYTCKVLEAANEGDVFIYTLQEEGWYQIKFGESGVGWIYQKYAKEI